MIGSAEAAVEQYLTTAGTALGSWNRPDDRPIPQTAFMERLEIVDEQGRVAGTIKANESFTLRVSVKSAERTPPAQVCVRVSNQDGVVIFASCNTDADGVLRPFEAGEHRYDVVIPGHFLAPGTYRVWVLLQVPRVVSFDDIDELVVNVEDTSSALRDDRGGVVRRTCVGTTVTNRSC